MKLLLRLIGIRLVKCCDNCDHFNHQGHTCIKKDAPMTNAFLDSAWRKDWFCCNWKEGEGKR